ncbi:C-factor-like [Penaeus japonicus]|uniref:C-factor-like n=1 Tax=Penaeus japonicus TaxID=27405 RepID=UPI001C70CE00|nr:C-factor-like [Penaeus japonicus]
MLARSVLVTGCSRGIGLELVRQLVSCDNPPAVVIGTCRNPDNAKELQELAEKYSNLKIIKFDVVDYASLSRVAEEVGVAVGAGGLNLLINNAGIMEKCPLQMFGVSLQNLEAKVFNEVLETNTTAPLMLVKELLPLLRKAAMTSGGPIGVSRAAVINMSTILASMGCFVGNADIYGYRASKTALNMLTKALSVDFGAEGLLFAALHPGWVQTDMGTTAGMLTTEQSVKDLLHVMATLTEKHNGAFLSHDGSELPW